MKATLIVIERNELSELDDDFKSDSIRRNKVLSGDAFDVNCGKTGGQNDNGWMSVGRFFPVIKIERVSSYAVEESRNSGLSGSAWSVNCCIAFISLS